MTHALELRSIHDENSALCDPIMRGTWLECLEEALHWQIDGVVGVDDEVQLYVVNASSGRAARVV